jgi:hypothetical protein
MSLPLRSFKPAQPIGWTGFFLNPTHKGGASSRRDNNYFSNSFSPRFCYFPLQRTPIRKIPRLSWGRRDRRSIQQRAGSIEQVTFWLRHRSQPTRSGPGSGSKKRSGLIKLISGDLTSDLNEYPPLIARGSACSGEPGGAGDPVACQYDVFRTSVSRPFPPENPSCLFRFRSTCHRAAQVQSGGTARNLVFSALVSFQTHSKPDRLRRSTEHAPRCQKLAKASLGRCRLPNWDYVSVSPIRRPRFGAARGYERGS